MDARTERNDNPLISLPQNVIDKIAMHLPSEEDVYNFSKVWSEFGFVSQPPTAHNWQLKHYHWDHKDMILPPDDPEVVSSTESLLEWRLKAQRNLMKDNHFKCWSSEYYDRDDLEDDEDDEIENNVRRVVINRQHRVVASLDDRGFVCVWNLQGQRLRQHGGCSVQYIGSSMDTAADTLVWYDERHHMHVQDLHTGRNVWVEELAWAPAHDATPNNWIPRPPLATRPQSTHLFSPNLVLATKRYEHVLLYDTRMSPNTNPAIHYRVPDTYGPYLMGAYAVHEGTRTMQVPSIHHVQSIVLGCDNECYEQPQMRLLDLRMMTAMHTQRSTRAMTRQGTCVFSVDLPKKTMYMDASGHTVVFGSVGDPVPCSECGCVHEEGFHEYQLVVWDAHEQTLLADEEGFGGEHIFGETNGQPRLSDDGRNVLVAAGTIDMECCLVWRIPMMSDRDWYRLRTANGGGAGRPVVRPCPMLSCMYTDSPTFSADMVDTLLVTGRNGTLHFYDFGEGSKESAGVGACTGCRRTPMRI